MICAKEYGVCLYAFRNMPTLFSIWALYITSTLFIGDSLGEKRIYTYLYYIGTYNALLISFVRVRGRAQIHKIITVCSHIFLWPSDRPIQLIKKYYVAFVRMYTYLKLVNHWVYTIVYLPIHCSIINQPDLDLYVIG
jgi:hypothetical protein